MSTPVDDTITDELLLKYATPTQQAEDEAKEPDAGQLTLSGIWLPHTHHRYIWRLNHGRRVSTRGIVIHVNAGSTAGTLSYFESGESRGVGAHFEIGIHAAWQLVPLEAKCWHAVSANPYYVGIEHSGFGRSRAEWMRGEELELSANRASWILHEYNLGPPVRNRNIFSHAHGGNSWGGHFYCPGNHFPWSDWMRLCKRAYDHHWGRR